MESVEVEAFVEGLACGQGVDELVQEFEDRVGL
ncbi:hypothetical protein ABH940_007261, partial [Streptacidiphilus sp. BW17]